MKVFSLITKTLFILIAITSCSVTNKMHNREKIITQLQEGNGNVFYASSTHITDYVIWSYSNTEIFVYKMSKGKITDKKVLKIDAKPSWLMEYSKEILTELDTCVELDGDIFGFKIEEEGKIEQEELPVSLDCFLRSKYKSDFLKGIVNDMNAYQIKLYGK